ncbi:hypothetical protein C8Q73DRAFT_789257 [Cubamyces lactineus]|nr:hypothetical protein C8Q73DRAFT_789257 [Cubamyces lactineus]
MATLFCANVIADTNTLTLSAKLQALWATLSEEPNECVAIAAPAPQRPAADFATILHWEESDEDTDGDDLMPPKHHNDAYLHSGGLYTQRVLARGRIMARYATEIDYMHAMNDPALANQAPPWPPAPEHVADALTWGAPASIGVAPHAYAPQDGDIETGASVSDTSDDWSAPSFGWTACIHDASGDEESSWGGFASSRYEDADSEDECATGFFIGHDGTAWPMPPPECLPHGCSAGGGSKEIDSASERMQPECWIVWSAADEEDHSAGSHSPTLDFESSAGDSERSSPSTTEGSLVTPTSQPSAPQDVPLADLGRLWYTSFGKELGLSTTLDALIDVGARSPPMPIEALAEEILPVCSLPEASSVRLFAADGFFLGRDGSLWPLPPSPPISYAFDMRRGGTVRYSSSHGPT